MSAVKWACPKCGADAGKHGKGGRDECQYARGSLTECGGFICECDDDGGGTHGTTLKDPCPQANCYHCGWGGTYPTKAHVAKQNLVPCPTCKGHGVVKAK